VDVCPVSQNLKRLEREKQRTFVAANFLVAIQNIYKNRFFYHNKLLIRVMGVVVVCLGIYTTIGFSEAIIAAIIGAIITAFLSHPLEYVGSHRLRGHN